MAEAPESRTQPSRSTREATDFEDREGHRAPFASSFILSLEPEAIRDQLLPFARDETEVRARAPPAGRVRRIVARGAHHCFRPGTFEPAAEGEPRSPGVVLRRDH